MFDVYGLVFDDSRIFNKKGTELKGYILFGQKYVVLCRQYQAVLRIIIIHR